MHAPARALTSSSFVLVQLPRLARTAVPTFSVHLCSTASVLVKHRVTGVPHIFQRLSTFTSHSSVSATMSQLAAISRLKKEQQQALAWHYAVLAKDGSLALDRTVDVRTTLTSRSDLHAHFAMHVKDAVRPSAAALASMEVAFRALTPDTILAVLNARAQHKRGAVGRRGRSQPAEAAAKAAGAKRKAS